MKKQNEEFVVSAIIDNNPNSNDNGLTEYGIYRHKKRWIFGKGRKLVERFYADDFGRGDYVLRRKVVGIGRQKDIVFAHMRGVRDIGTVDKVLLNEAKERVLVWRGEKSVEKKE